ncbi:unnamed protein product [Cyprideis torosa]|uniref:Uncharacterized protein n=1 Tax=Cyprideis torosa TaxID=163714 RepID=A0A7R8WY38_9CRUS|nr:unnamed protein product [Cyprideis torosa]CAG0909439.1 unnamed protein product [Cyprideis torosa]
MARMNLLGRSRRRRSWLPMESSPSLQQLAFLRWFRSRVLPSSWTCLWIPMSRRIVFATRFPMGR